MKRNYLFKAAGAFILGMLLIGRGVPIQAHAAPVSAQVSANSDEHIEIPEFEGETGTLVEWGNCGEDTYTGSTEPFHTIRYFLFDSGNCYVTQGITYENGVIYLSLETLETDETLIKNPDMVKHVYIGPGIYGISKGLFTGLTSIESVEMKSGMNNILPDAFNGCTGIKTVSLPDGLQVINGRAFQNCVSLEEIVIPDSVQWMEGSGIFKGCKKLKKVTLPKEIEKLGAWIFESCRSLTDITLPDTLKELPTEAFSGCSSLSNITIPDSVTKVGQAAFQDCISLTSITVPNSIQQLEMETFEGCTGLTNVDLPDGLTALGGYVFKDCTSLENIELPNGLTSIGGGCFSGCTAMESITIPNSVTSIARDTFNDCTNLKNVNLPSGLRVVYPMFENCTSLESITIPEGVTELATNAFNRYWNKKSALKSISLPSTLEKIGNTCFNESDKLESIVIPASVTSMGFSTFDGCNVLSSVAFEGNKLAELPKRCFCDCRKLENVVLPDGLTKIGDQALSGCIILKKINIPASVTEIGNKALYDCRSLKEIVFEGDNVETIGEQAFYHSVYQDSLVLPSSVKKVGSAAFGDNGILKSLVFTGDKPELEDDILSGSANAKLYYPAGNDTWANIQEELGDSVTCLPYEKSDFLGSAGVTLAGYSISLQDGCNIGLNYYLEINSSNANVSTGRMEFVIPDIDDETGTKTRTEVVNISDAKKTSANGKFYYMFQCPVAAKEMSCQITAQYKYEDYSGTVEGDTYTYSVKSYADYLLQNADTNEDYAKAAQLVRAMLKYGAAAQTQFDYFTDSPADSNVNYIPTQGIADAKEAAKTAASNQKTEQLKGLLTSSGLDFYGMSLILRDNPVYALYFEKTDNESSIPEITCTDHKIVSKEIGNFICYEIADIRPGTLLNNITITASNNSIVVNPGSYLYSVLSNTNGQAGDDLKNVVTALYNLDAEAGLYYENR